MNTNLAYKELEAKKKCQLYITQFYNIWERKGFEQRFYVPIAEALLGKFGVKTLEVTEEQVIELEDLIEGRE